jgi:hypothetical protein
MEERGKMKEREKKRKNALSSQRRSVKFGNSVIQEKVCYETWRPK